MRKLIKLAPITLVSATMAIAPALISAGSKQMATNTTNMFTKHQVPVNDVDTVLSRFLSDVKANHSVLLDQYLNDYMNMNKQTFLLQYSNGRSHTSQFMHWDENHEWNYFNTTKDLVLLDNTGTPFIESKARLVCSQGLTQSGAQNVNVFTNGPDSIWFEHHFPTLTQHESTDFGKPWGDMQAWMHDSNNTFHLENVLSSFVQADRQGSNINFDNVHLYFKSADPNNPSCLAEIQESGSEGRGFYNQYFNEFWNATKTFRNWIPVVAWKPWHNGETHLPSSGHGVTWWLFEKPAESIDINYWTYSLNNLFQIKDFGYDSTDGYYYTLGINDLYLVAAEGEKLNLQTQNWWDSELLSDGDRPNWIPYECRVQPAYEKIRDQFFSEVQKLITDRVITYDNYETVRKYVHDIAAQSRQCPAEGWLTDELKNNIDLKNTGWTDISRSYQLEHCSDAWDRLVTILPELHYTIRYDRNSNPDTVEGGEWEDLQAHQASYDWESLTNRVKVPLGYDGKNSVAFKAEVDVVTAENETAPMHVDTWRGNFDASNNPIDTNITNNLLPIEFLFDNTVQLKEDPKDEHPDHNDTYWHFDKNMKKLCNVQNEPNKSLNLRNDCSQYLPSVMWELLDGSTSGKLQQILKDEKGNPANVFAYKNIQGEYDYDINDEFIKVQPDDKNGRLIIRLINPNDQSIVSTVDLNGFLKDDGYSDIIFPFGKIFCTMTGTATDNIQVEVLNPKSDTVLEYAIEDPSVATVTKTDTTGRTIKISGLVYGITKVNVALKDAAGMTLSTTEFWIYVDVKPEAMDLVQPFNEANIKTGTTGVAEDGQNFKVEVYSDKEKTEKDCLQYATYRLIGAPEWIGISNSDIWEDPRTGEVIYIEAGYIYVIDAKAGTYTFTVEATNWVDETLKVSSETITFVVSDNPIPPSPEHKVNVPAIVGGTVGGVAVAGAGTGFGVFAYRRRKGPSTRHNKGGK